MKQRQNVLDYDDLLLYFAQMLAEPAIAAEIAARFDHLLVDEYQDTNALQGEIVLALRPQGRGPHRGRRRRAGDLFLPRRDRAQHPRFSARVRSARACGDARAQLPLERRDPRRRQRGHRARARALRQDPLHRAAAWAPSRAGHRRRRRRTRRASSRPACSPIARRALRSKRRRCCFAPPTTAPRSSSSSPAATCRSSNSAA